MKIVAAGRRAMPHVRRALTAVVLLQFPVPLAAQSGSGTPAATGVNDTVRALPGPPVRRIESAQAVSTEPLGSINGVRHLPDGRVLVNDATRRRLLLMDSTLTRVTVLLDSLTEIRNAYGTGAGTLLPGQNGGSLFIDRATLSVLVLDNKGAVRRVRAVPLVQHVFRMTSAEFGVPAVDTKERLVYLIDASMAPPAAAPAKGGPVVWPLPDSAFLVGVGLETRKIDTLGVLRIPVPLHSSRLEPEGYYSLNYILHPLPLVDGWAVLSDGAVAFVRGIDYRVEFRAPDGTVTSSEKLPFPWVPLTDADKARFADSVNTAAAKAAQWEFTTLVIAWSNLLNKPYPRSLVVPAGYVPPPGLPTDWILPNGVAFRADYIGACPPGVPSPPEGQTTVIRAPAGADASSARTTSRCTSSRFVDTYGSGYAPPPPSYRAPTRVRLEDLPDYKPPIAPGAVRADADGNLWVLTIPMRTTPGGHIYDVISRRGEMIDRIQLPAGFALEGFGAGKVVYLSNRDASGLHLSRVRLR